MKNNYIIGAFVVVIVGGAFLYSNSMQNEKVMKQGDAMTAENHNTSGGEAMMVADGNAMKGGDAMMASGDTMMNHDMMGVGILLKNGKIVLEEGEKMTPLTDAYTFKTGLKVSLTGKITKTDGTTAQLAEGESVWQDGMVMKAGEMMMEEGTVSGSAMKSATVVPKPGSYVPYDSSKIALAKTGKVVLNFRASWCPSCQALNKDIIANAKNIPSNLTILDVDYDNSVALKQKYGVTYQHTMVQVDASGAIVKKWSGSPTLAAFVAEVK